MCDYGYSIAAGVNEDEASRELPGTPPFTAPEVLRARHVRFKNVQQVLADAAGALADVAWVGSIAKDHRQGKQKDDEALSSLRRALDDPSECGEALRARMPARLAATIERGHAALAPDDDAPISWARTDVFSCAIVAWCLLHGGADPYNETAHGRGCPEQAVAAAVMRGVRPDLKSPPAPALTKVWDALTRVDGGARPGGAEPTCVLERCWHADPKSRPSIGELCRAVDGTLPV